MSLDMIIEPETGIVRLGAIDALMPRERLARVRPRVAHLLHAHQDHGNGYRWLYLNGLRFGGHSASLSLCFGWRGLEMMSWSVDLPGSPSGWPTQAAIHTELAFVRAALADMIGFAQGDGAMRFSWGSVWSSYDPKAGIASSGLRYA